MAELFGLDIAGLVASSIAGAGGLRAGTLTRSTSTHSFQGFLEVRETRLPDSFVVESRPVLTMLGASISPATAPQVNDEATLDGVTYELVRLVGSDPAQAVYEFEVR